MRVTPEETKVKGGKAVQDAYNMKMLAYQEEVKRINRFGFKGRDRRESLKQNYRDKNGITHEEYEAWMKENKK